jgi:hypothetical protein
VSYEQVLVGCEPGVLAVTDRLVIRLRVCDDRIVVPLGMFTLSGTCAACLSLHGAAADKKLLVHPKSIIAVSSVVALEVVGVQSKDNAK